MNNPLSWIVSNKLLLVMVFSFIFTVVWGVVSWSSLSNYYCYYDCAFHVAESMWISILVFGSFTFLGASGCYIRNRLRSGQATQNQAIEFNTSSIELSPASVNNFVDSVQNKLTEEDLDKEISLFEKRKKLAQLKNEVISLETVAARASTSSSLGQVVVARRDC